MSWVSRRLEIPGVSLKISHFPATMIFFVLNRYMPYDNESFLIQNP